MKIKSDKQIRKQILFWAALCVMFFCLSVRVHAENEYQVTEMQMQGILTTDSALNVRSGPGKEYEVIGKVKNDVMLAITGQTENGWYQIELDGQTGYVSAQYVTVQEPEQGEETIGEPEEGYRGFRQSPQMKKIILIGAVIIIVLIMLVVTLKNMRREDEDEEDDSDDEEYDEDDGDDGDDGEEYDDADSAEQYQSRKPVGGTENAPKREYVIREEDYRVEIDPSFFEDKEFIEQPDMVTGYLERILVEENRKENKREAQEEKPEDKQRELEQAMAKLNELQKEIERLKNEN